MRFLRSNVYAAILGVVALVTAAALAAADYYGYAVLGDSAVQQSTSTQQQFMHRFHK